MKYSKTKLENKKAKSFLSNKVKLTIVSCCISIISFTSCGGNDDQADLVDCANGLWTQSVQTELSSWLAAAQAYGTDQTPANCQKYKSTGQAYINALDKIKKCVPASSLTDFEQSLKEAKEEISALSC